MEIKKSSKHVTATIKSNVIDKINDLVTKGRFRNRSHAIEEGLKKLIAEQEA